MIRLICADWLPHFCIRRGLPLSSNGDSAPRCLPQAHSEDSPPGAPSRSLPEWSHVISNFIFPFWILSSVLYAACGMDDFLAMSHTNPASSLAIAVRMTWRLRPRPFIFR